MQKLTGAVDCSGQRQQEASHRACGRMQNAQQSTAASVRLAVIFNNSRLPGDIGSLHSMHICYVVHDACERTQWRTERQDLRSTQGCQQQEVLTAVLLTMLTSRWQPIQIELRFWCYARHFMSIAANQAQAPCVAQSGPLLTVDAGHLASAPTGPRNWRPRARAHQREAHPGHLRASPTPCSTTWSAQRRTWLNCQHLACRTASG